MTSKVVQENSIKSYEHFSFFFEIRRFLRAIIYEENEEDKSYPNLSFPLGVQQKLSNHKAQCASCTDDMGWMDGTRYKKYPLILLIF